VIGAGGANDFPGSQSMRDLHSCQVDSADHPPSCTVVNPTINRRIFEGNASFPLRTAASCW
jgi:hypothetical protein